MPEPIRVLHVGVDHPHAAGWRTLLDRAPGVAVVGHVTDATGRADTLTGPLRDKPVHQNLDQALTQIPCDAALVTLSNDQTVSACETLCAAGKHLLLEKPVCGTAADMQRITDAIHRAGLVAEVAYTWRCHPISRNIRRLVAQGHIGRILAAELRMLATYVSLRGADHYLFRRSVSTGGYFSWLACHWIDLLHYLVDEPVVAVAAITQTLTSEPIDVEDVGGAVLQLASGAVVNLHCGYVLPEGKDLYVGLNGDHGWVRWPDAGDRCHVHSDRPEWASQPEQSLDVHVDHTGGYSGQMGRELLGRFAERIQGQGEPINPPEQNVACLRVIDAIYESARTGGRVDLT